MSAVRTAEPISGFVIGPEETTTPVAAADAAVAEADGADVVTAAVAPALPVPAGLVAQPAAGATSMASSRTAANLLERAFMTVPPLA